MRSYVLIGLIFSLSAFNLHAQIECSPNTDFCFPQQEPGHVIVVPSPNTPTIQSAIDQAPQGATIRIKGGEYFENIVIYKNVKFSGNNPPGKPTTIHSANSNYPIFKLYGSPSVGFKNLKLKDGIAGILSDLQNPNGPSVVAKDSLN